MTRPVLAALLLLALPVTGVAQSDAPAATQQDPKAAYSELARSFAKAVTAWQEELQAKIEEARKSGQRVPRAAFAPPTREFVAKAQELAKQYAGKDDAVPFLTFVLKNASVERDAVKQAVKTLAEDHVKSLAIADVVDYLPKWAQERTAVKLLDEVADEHDHHEVRAKALLARARMNAEADVKAAVADLELVKTLSKDEDLLEEAAEALVEVQHLAVGTKAPDIVGVDVDGVPFKLSDYRGKAVLLDFWGFW